MSSSSSIFGVSYNVINSILGAGMIAIPCAFQLSGAVAGIVLVLFCCYMSTTSLNVLISSANAVEPRCKSYAELVERAFGRPGFYFTLMMMATFTFGAMTTYVVMLCDMIPRAFPVFSPLGAAALCTAFFAPISLTKDIARLEKYSFLAIVSLIIFTFCMGQEAWRRWFFSGQNVEPPPLTLLRVPSVAQGFGIIVAAFVCQHNTFAIYASMKIKSQWPQAVTLSMLVSTLMLLVSGVAGYVAFAPTVAGDVLVNFNLNNQITLVAYACASFILILTYPLEIFISRDAIEQALVAYRIGEHKDVAALSIDESYHARFIGPRLTKFISLALVFGSSTLAYLWPNASQLFGLIGSFAAMAVAYVIPFSIALKFRMEKVASSSSSLSPSTSLYVAYLYDTKVLKWLVLSFVGAVALVICTFQTLLDIYNTTAMAIEH